MECNKCDFKTENIKEMDKHLEDVHKIHAMLEYSPDSTNLNSRYINSLKELNHVEIDALKPKLMECAICRETGIKEHVSAEELNKILVVKGHPSGLSKTTEGYFGDGEGPEWVCARCYKREKTRVKYWNTLKQLTEMQNTMMNECEDKTDELIEASIFEDKEYDEGCGLILNYTKKIKGKERFFKLSSYDYNKIDWQDYGENEECKKYLTPKQMEDIENAARIVLKNICEEERKITDKWQKKMGVTVFEYDEGVITYRKDFKKFSYEEDKSALFTISYYPDYGEPNDDTVAEDILQKKSLRIGDYEFEVFITDCKVKYEVLWKIKEVDVKKPYPQKMIERKILSLTTLNPSSDDVDENLQERIDKLRQLFTYEENEVEKILFANQELRFSRKDVEMSKEELKHLWHPSDLFKFNMQMRKHYETVPFSEPIEIKSHELRQLIDLYKKEVAWVEIIDKKVVIPGKINKVGENSRHVVLDKNRGLIKFLGWDIEGEYDPPTETEVKVEYGRDRITITKLKPREKEELILQ